MTANAPLSPEHAATVRALLGLWLADPPADLDAAVAWCERWVASRPYALAINTTTPWVVAGAYRSEHPSKLDRWTLALTGYRETR